MIDKRKIVVLLILCLLGLIPFVFHQAWDAFVTEYMGAAMLLPFFYGGAIMLFWAWADGTIYDTRRKS